MSEESFPHVRFEVFPVEDRQASLDAGHYVSKDLHYAYITRPGQKDTLVKEATQYIKDLTEAARNGRVPATWPEHFKKLYSAWRDGIEIPPEGTPILGWAVIPPAAQKALTHAGIRTVEDLAALPEQDMTSVGMGAVSWRQKAVAWLETASGVGKTVERLTALELQLAEATKIIEKQAQVIAKLTPEESKPTAKAA